MIKKLTAIIVSEVNEVFGLNPTIEDVTDYMITNHLICPNCIRDYLIRHDFNELIGDAKNRKEVIYALADKYNISDSSVYFILYPEKR